MPGPPPLPDDGKQIGLKIFSLVVGAGFVMTLALFGWTGPPFDTMYRDLNIQSPTQGFVPMSFCLMMGAAIAALIFFKDFFATRRRALGLNIALLILILVVYIFWMVLMMMPLWQFQSRGRAPKKRIKRLERNEAPTSASLTPGWERISLSGWRFSMSDGPVAGR